MTVDNNTNLISQICSRSGLKGEALDALKRRLEQQSREELEAELVNSLINGDTNNEKGLAVEHGRSAVMLDNYDRNTYTDTNGRVITEYKDGDSLLQKVIATWDNEGNKTEEVITYIQGRPSTRTVKKNGKEESRSTYTYIKRKTSDNKDTYTVKIETENANGEKSETHVLTTDREGKYPPAFVLGRKNTDTEGNTTEIYPLAENLVEVKTSADGEKVITVYDTVSIENYTSKKRIYQRLQNSSETAELLFDGKGNTITTVNAGDGWEKLARRFHTTPEELKKLNPKIKSLKAGQDIIVPGEFDIKSKEIGRVQSRQEALTIAHNAEIDRQIGEKVAEGTDAKYLAELKANGFKPTVENYGFYKQFNKLDNSSKNNVINAIKYYRKSEHITDNTKIKEKLMEQLGVNLFDSGKTIKMSDNSATPYALRKKDVSLETFLTKTCKLDIKKEPAKIIYERLASLPQEELNKIIGNRFSDMSSLNSYHDIAAGFESCGITLRTNAERQMDLNSKKAREEVLGDGQITRGQTVDFALKQVQAARKSLEKHLADLKDNPFRNLGEIIIEDYRFWGIELNPINSAAAKAFSALARKLGFKKGTIEGLTKSINAKINELKEKEIQLTSLKGSTSSADFASKYASITGGSYKPFEVEKIQELCKNPPKQGTKEYKIYEQKVNSAIESLMGENFAEEVSNYISTSAGLGSAVEMAMLCYATMGMGSTVTIGSKTFTGATATGRALIGVTHLGGYTAARTSLNFLDDIDNVINGNKTVGGVLVGESNADVIHKGAEIVKEWALGKITREEADKQLGKIGKLTFDDFVSSNGGQFVVNTLTSSAFGAAAGLASPIFAKAGQFGTSLGQKLGLKAPMLSEVTAKIISGNPNGINGAEFMAKVYSAMNKTNIVGKGIQFAVETAVFYATNLPLSLIQEKLSESNNEMEKAYQEGRLTEYLLTRFKDEAINLATVQSIGMIVAMMTGANPAVGQLKESFNEYETLKNTTIKYENINGQNIVTVEGTTGKLFVEGDLIKFYSKSGELVQSEPVSDAEAFKALDAGTKTFYLMNRFMQFENYMRSQNLPVNTSGTSVQDAEYTEIRNTENTQSVQAAANIQAPAEQQSNNNNITELRTPQEVGQIAAQRLQNSKYRIATAGYTANPPQGYESFAKTFLLIMDRSLGAASTAYITSPTTSRGSIDAITSEVEGFEDGTLFYTTAQNYVGYAMGGNGTGNLDSDSWAKVPKYVLPTTDGYSQATAEASNSFIAIGGKVTTINDFVNAIKHGNKAVIVNNTSIENPVWENNSTQNASRYLAEQIQAVKEGKPLPYPEVGEFTKEFIEQNLDKFSSLVKILTVDGSQQQTEAAGLEAAKFLKAETETTAETNTQPATKTPTENVAEFRTMFDNPKEADAFLSNFDVNNYKPQAEMFSNPKMLKDLYDIFKPFCLNPDNKTADTELLATKIKTLFMNLEGKVTQAHIDALGLLMKAYPEHTVNFWINQSMLQNISETNIGVLKAILEKHNGQDLVADGKILVKASDNKMNIVGLDYVLYECKDNEEKAQKALQIINDNSYIDERGRVDYVKLAGTLQNKDIAHAIKHSNDKLNSNLKDRINSSFGDTEYPEATALMNELGLKRSDVSPEVINKILNGGNVNGIEYDALPSEQMQLLKGLLLLRDEHGYLLLSKYYLDSCGFNKAIRNARIYDFEYIIEFVKQNPQIKNNLEDLVEILNESEPANDLKNFLISPDFEAEIKANSAGKYQTELLEILTKSPIRYEYKMNLLKSGLTKADFLSSLRKFSKSTFKLAYETPNQYLSGVDTKYSTPVNGKYPNLDTDETREELEEERCQIIKFFFDNIGNLFRALKYIDTDTIAHIMDKRTTQFEDTLKDLNTLTDDNYELLSGLLKCKSSKTGKPLSPRDKIQMTQLVLIYQKAHLDMSQLQNAAQNGQVNIQEIKDFIQNKVLERAGINPNEIQIDDSKKKFNEDFFYLTMIDQISDNLEQGITMIRNSLKEHLPLLRTNKEIRESAIETSLEQMKLHADIMTDEQRAAAEQLLEIYRNIENYTDEQIIDVVIRSVKASAKNMSQSNEIYTVIRESLQGDFKEFINNPSNEYGQANLKTQEAFREKGLNYNLWDNSHVPDRTFNIGNHKLTIKLWNRNPQEDLFMGNKTSCCTQIGTGVNAAATPIFLESTCFQVIQIYDENNNVIGMARVFMAEVEGKPSLIMDTIEFNKVFIKDLSLEDKTKTRDELFHWANQYAQQVTGDADTQVYFANEGAHAGFMGEGLTTERHDADFIGSIAAEKVYINAADFQWLSPENLKNYKTITSKRDNPLSIEWTLVPKDEPYKAPTEPSKAEHSQNIADAYDGKGYPYFDEENARFTPEANAPVLERVTPSDEQEYIHISTETQIDGQYPGTIAGTTTLDKALYTDGMVQCAALVVVDRANNTQTLIHCFPGNSMESSRLVIENILAGKNPNDLEISVVAGYSETAPKTVQFILDTVKDITNGKEVQLYNFADYKDLKIFHRGLILQDGKLKCCDDREIKNKITNPEENITYCKFADKETRTGAIELFDGRTKVKTDNSSSQEEVTDENVRQSESEFLNMLNDSERKKYEQLIYNYDKYKNLTNAEKIQALTIWYYQANIVGQLKDNYVPEIETVKQKTAFINDAKIKSYLEAELEKIKDLPEAERNEQLLELEYLADAVNNLNSKYSMIHTKSSLMYNLAAQAHRIQSISTKSGTNLEFKPEAQDKIDEHIHYDGLKNYIIKYSAQNPEMSDYLYSLYIENLSPEIKAKCDEISKTTGVKIFIDNTDTKQMEHLNTLQEELTLWKNAGLKVPAVFDEFDVSSTYLLIEMNTKMHAGALTLPDYNYISASAVNINELGMNYRAAIRHELTHLNDTNFEVALWDENNPVHKEILSNKEKYAQYLKAAGTSDTEIEYAFSMPREFSAVAMQFDITKYPQEFKNLLIKMGVPKEALNFEPIKSDKPSFTKMEINSDDKTIKSVKDKLFSGAIDNTAVKPKFSQDEFVAKCSELFAEDFEEPISEKFIEIYKNSYLKNREAWDYVLNAKDFDGNPIPEKLTLALLLHTIEGKPLTISQAKIYMLSLNLYKHPDVEYSQEFGVSEKDFRLLKLLEKSRHEVQGDWEFDSGLPSGSDDIFDIIREIDGNDVQKDFLIQTLENGYTQYHNISDDLTCNFRNIKTPEDAKELFALFKEVRKQSGTEHQAMQLADLLDSPQIKELAFDLIKIFGTANGRTISIILTAKQGGYDRIRKLIDKKPENYHQELSYFGRISDTKRNIMDKLEQSGVLADERFSPMLIYSSIYINTADNIIKRDLLRRYPDLSATDIIELSHDSDKVYQAILDNNLLEDYSVYDAGQIGAYIDSIKAKDLLKYRKTMPADVMIMLSQNEALYKDFIENPNQLKYAPLGVDRMRMYAAVDSINPDLTVKNYMQQTESEVLFTLAERLCSDVQAGILDKQDCRDIFNSTDKETAHIVKTIYLNRGKYNITPQDVAICARNLNLDNKDLTLDLLDDAEFNKKYLLKVLNYASNKNCTDAVQNMISNPQMKSWFYRNLDNELDMDTIVGLARTQRKLNQEAANPSRKTNTKAEVTEAKGSKIEEAKPHDVQDAIDKMVALGMDKTMAERAYVKLCMDKQGNVDKIKLNAVLALVQTYGINKYTNDKGKLRTNPNISPKEIAEILEFSVGSALSNANGLFRPDIAKDIITLRKAGITDVKLATTLSCIKNMGIVEMKDRFNTKVRQDAINRVAELPENIKQEIISSGFDLDLVMEKASQEAKGGKVKKEKLETVTLRSLDSLHGAERILATKFKQEIETYATEHGLNNSQEVWGNEETFKRWAEEKLEDILDFEKHPEYTAKGDYEGINQARKDGVQKWIDYLRQESDYKDNVFVHLLVMESVVKEFKPDNAVTPKPVSHEVFNQVHDVLLADGNKNTSFDKIYAEKMREKAIEQFSHGTETVDGVEGQWVTIPRSKKGEPDYDEHIAMVQSLAEGSSWCLRFDNAHGYLQGGNLHFFIDKNGRAQVAMHETDGQIQQIQKRYNQDCSVPVPYVNVINTFKKNNGFKGMDSQIQKALDAKPEFDKIKEQANELMAQEKYEELFSLLLNGNIGEWDDYSIVKNSDGTYTIENYNALLNNNYTIADLGIDENKLMKNVSRITGHLNLDGSGLTEMKNLRIVDGNITFGDSQISDLRSLERIGNHRVSWNNPTDSPTTPPEKYNIRLSDEEKALLNEYDSEKQNIILDFAQGRAFDGEESRIRSAITTLTLLGFDEQKIARFKTLSAIELKPYKFNSEAERNNFTGKLKNKDIIQLVNHFKTDDEINTIKVLLENNAESGFLRVVKPVEFIYSTINLKIMKEYLDLIGENEDLLANLDISYIQTNMKYKGLIAQIIAQNPNITFADLKTQLDKAVNEGKKVNGIIELRERTQHFKNYELKELARKLGGRYLYELDNIDLKLEGVKDEKLIQYANEVITEALTSEDISAEKLDRLNTYLDIYHTLIGTYENNTFNRDGFRKQYLENKPQAEATLDRAENDDVTGSGVRRSTLIDYADEARVADLRQFLIDNRGDEMGTYFWREYYLKSRGIPEDIQQQCIEIDEKYRVKIFLTSDLTYAKEDLYFLLNTEYPEWAAHGKDSAKFPPVLDFSKIKSEYINDKAAYGQTNVSGYYSLRDKEIAMNGLKHSSEFQSMSRHEHTHANANPVQVPKELIDEIMPHKENENGVSVPDFENCKYREEFVRAGIQEYKIKYAYNNPEEFIAVAAEGDMRQYSDEFKQLLVKFGMPEWQLDMECKDAEVKGRALEIKQLKKHLEEDFNLSFETYDEMQTNLYVWDRAKALTDMVVKELHRQYDIPNEPMKVFDHVIKTGDIDFLEQCDIDVLKDILMGKEEGAADTPEASSDIYGIKNINGDIDETTPISKETKDKLISAFTLIGNNMEMINKFLSIVPNEYCAKVVLAYLSKYTSADMGKYVKRELKDIAEIADEGNAEDIKKFVKFLQNSKYELYPETALDGYFFLGNDRAMAYQEIGLWPKARMFAMDELKAIHEMQDAKDREKFAKVYSSVLFSRNTFADLYMNRGGIVRADLSKLDRLDALCDKLGWGDEMSVNDALSLLELADYEIDIIEQRGLLKHIPNRERKLSGYDVLRLMRIDDTVWDTIQKRKLLEDIPERTNKYAKSLSAEDAIAYALLSDDEWQRILDMGLLTQESKNNSSLGSLDNYNKASDNIQLAKMSIEQIESFSKYQSIKRTADKYNRADKPMFSTTESLHLAMLPDAVRKFIDKCIDLKKSDGNFYFNTSFDYVSYLSNMSEAEIQKAEERGLLREIEITRYRTPEIVNFSASDIQAMAKLSDEEWARFEALGLNDTDKFKFYPKLLEFSEEQWAKLPKDLSSAGNLDIMFTAISMDEKAWNRYLQDFSGKTNLAVDDYTIKNILRLDDDKYTKFKGFATNTARQDKLHDFEILKLINLDEKAYSRIKDDLYHIEGFKSELDCDEMIKVAQLSDKEYDFVLNNYLKMAEGKSTLNINAACQFVSLLGDKEIKNYSKEEVFKIINYIGVSRYGTKIPIATDYQTRFAVELCTNEKLKVPFEINVLSDGRRSDVPFVQKLINNLNETHYNEAIRLLQDEEMKNNPAILMHFPQLLRCLYEGTYDNFKTLITELVKDESITADAIHSILTDFELAVGTKEKAQEASSLAVQLVQDDKFPNELIRTSIKNTRFDYDAFKENVDQQSYDSKVAKIRALRDRILSNPNLQKDYGVQNMTLDEVKDEIRTRFYNCFDSYMKYFDLAETLKAQDENVPDLVLMDIMQSTYDANYDISKKLCEEYKALGIEPSMIKTIIQSVNNENREEALNLINNYKKLELTPNQIAILLRNSDKISIHQLRTLNKKLGHHEVSKFSQNDLVIACKFVELCDKKNINEIPIERKRTLLRDLVASNNGLFNISDELSSHFPLLPRSQEDYCSLLPSIVRSLGIETNELTPEQRITMFNSSMSGLSQTLARLSDTDFSNLKITQEYDKDKFITDVLEQVKTLPRGERQKVYDYFGFELHHSKESTTGFRITGYPVNLNNGKKLAQIDNPRTKAVVESLRPYVIKFSENNKIKCDNPQVEQLVNEIISALPELRTAIGKVQHGAHAYDVFQHSLKVMQKITQDERFNNLSESDKKVMLLASLLHDITKIEGKVDKTHAEQSSFDTFFIAQKFNLTKEEEIKLHTLIKHHEWLAYVNSSKSDKQLTQRLQSVAYDLQQGNLFDMAEIFTNADLRAVRSDDSFRDTTEGKSRIGFDGTVRSFGESANIYAQRIRGYVAELQKTQPLLPQTKIPRASRINDAITYVNEDGSTNIKGVYKDKDGLIIIKFNEVEDWEAIGFPKGSVSRGIETEGNDEHINTGNIKFFVHALNYANQLAKFDAFSLVDSDALLSVSYAERPESKYRFFRSQGVILDVNSKYIHGGGDHDSGSGCGKDINEFKKNYIFGGYREGERVYVSNLIKEATGMTDEEYVKFFEEYKDKTMQEIEPPELRDKIIKALATINSNTRRGNRNYNEMYISNPNEVMGVFAYNINYNEKIGNPVAFLNRTTIGKYETGLGSNGKDLSVSERTAFLRQYALERDLPFIVFGD